MIPTPRQFDFGSTLAEHWAKAAFVLSGQDHLSPTREELAPYVAEGTASLHHASGVFETIEMSRAVELVDRFYRRESFDSTLKISSGPVLDESIEPWREMFKGARVQTNLYFASGNTQGLRPHYDDHHVFALQLVGAKKWRLGARVAIATPEVVGYYPDEEPEFESEVTVEVGEALYLPSGFWHGATTEQRSLHATVGIYPPTYAEYARRLIAHRCEDDGILSSELPACPESLAGREVEFSRPSTGTIDDITSRIARSSSKHQSLAADGLMLSCGDSDEEAFVGALDELWEYAERLNVDPTSLYIRGSMARWLAGEAIHDPWDIDVVLVTEHEMTPEDNSQAILRGVDLPLDLLSVTVSALSSEPWYQPTRRLLSDEGRLIRGFDIVYSLPEIEVSESFAAIVGRRQLAAYRANVLAIDTMGTDDLALLT